MPFVTGLRCVFCGTLQAATAHTCASCGLTGILDVEYDYAAIARRLTRPALARRARDQWRYRELLPIRPRATLPPLSVGWTPIGEAPALARHVGVKALFLKDEGRNATGSLKDRASAVGAVKAREARAAVMACASTGNAADRKSTRLNSSHIQKSRMPSSA